RMTGQANAARPHTDRNEPVMRTPLAPPTGDQVPAVPDRDGQAEPPRPQPTGDQGYSQSGARCGRRRAEGWAIGRTGPQKAHGESGQSSDIRNRAGSVMGGSFRTDWLR